MITPLQRLVGPFSKPIKITALTHMIPRGVDAKVERKYFSTLIPFKTENFLLSDIQEDNYLIPKSKFEYLVSKEDIDDWSFLLKRFDSMIANLIRLLNNIRKIYYQKVVYSKKEFIEIQNRHNKLQEKILEKSEDKKTKAIGVKTDKEKIDSLISTLVALGFGSVSNLITEDLSGLQTGNVHKKGASIAKMLMQRYGLTDVQASAIVGNFIRESGLVPYNVEDISPYDAQEPLPPPWGTPRTGYGWAQWTGGRLNVFLEKFLGGGPNKRGKAANDGDNWRMLTYELDGPYNDVIQGIKGYTDIVQATIYAEQNYEGALIKANDERINAARGVLKEVRQKARGGIVIPEIFNRYTINYDTNIKNTLLSNFIVDRPTVLNVQKIGEPLIVIPIKRPIGISVLKTLFKEPFRRIESIFSQTVYKKSTAEKQKEKEQTPIKNTQTSITRTTIPSMNSITGSTSPVKQDDKDIQIKYEDYQSKNSLIDIGKLDYIDKIIQTIEQTIEPSLTLQSSKLNLIDTTEQKTSDVFGNDKKVILLTQEIEVIEE